MHLPIHFYVIFFFFLTLFILSHEPRLYKRVCLSAVRWSVGPSVSNAFASAGRDEPANDSFCVYKLVYRDQKKDIDKHNVVLTKQQSLCQI